MEVPMTTPRGSRGRARGWASRREPMEQVLGLPAGRAAATGSAGQPPRWWK